MFFLSRISSQICVQAISQTECIALLKKCLESNKELQAMTCETLSRLFKCQHVSEMHEKSFKTWINRNCVFDCSQDSLIRQSLDCTLIPYLLKILDSRMEYTENPSMVRFRWNVKIIITNDSHFLCLICVRMQVKAQIVAALKAMTHNLNYGDKVSHLLNSNPIWAEFRDQKHDLFITDSNIRGYLTGTHSINLSINIPQYPISLQNLNIYLNAGVAPTAGYLTQGPSKTTEVLTSPPPIDRDDPLARRTEDA